MGVQECREISVGAGLKKDLTKLSFIHFSIQYIEAYHKNLTAKSRETELQIIPPKMHDSCARSTTWVEPSVIKANAVC